MGKVDVNIGMGVVAEGASVLLQFSLSKAGACFHRFASLGDATGGTDRTRWETYVIDPASGTFSAWESAMLGEYGSDTVDTEQGSQTLAAWWSKTRAEDRSSLYQVAKRLKTNGWMGA